MPETLSRQRYEMFLYAHKISHTKYKAKMHIFVVAFC